MGQGSRFEVMLALANPPRDEMHAAAAPARATRRKILVVDDSRDSAEALSVVLGQMGHEVITAYGAHEAISKAKAFNPDVVFLDIGLPEMDGYELPGTKGAQMLALTGYGRASDRQLALESGFDDHLVKPLDPERLAELIR